jgi:hypothetical protein
MIELNLDSAEAGRGVRFGRKAAPRQPCQLTVSTWRRSRSLTRSRQVAARLGSSLSEGGAQVASVVTGIEYGDGE